LFKNYFWHQHIKTIRKYIKNYFKQKTISNFKGTLFAPSCSLPSRRAVEDKDARWRALGVFFCCFFLSSPPFFLPLAMPVGYLWGFSGRILARLFHHGKRIKFAGNWCLTRTQIPAVLPLQRSLVVVSSLDFNHL